ncbi:VanZ family protein [butyrate-producing bacterium]|uniref:VanZ family protein n=1 Tax=Clostridium sp. AM34-11AC TaxID=2305242 RepID=UPI0015F31793|nr:VanZ family protein [Clostridium sp. AM34-11AC]MBS5272936.1 VanZ family protein [butyrate-producing bacterium]
MKHKKDYPAAVKLLFWLPAACIAAAIFWFSAQPAAESTEMSDTVSHLILLLGTKLGFFHGNPAQYADLIELMSFPVRKTAHMTEYLVFYCAVRFGLHFTYQPLNVKRRLLTALAIVFLYACTDEFHQFFVPGRAGRFTDVLIDCFGCAVVTLICTIKKSSSQR